MRLPVTTSQTSDVMGIYIACWVRRVDVKAQPGDIFDERCTYRYVIDDDERATVAVWSDCDGVALELVTNPSHTDSSCLRHFGGHELSSPATAVNSMFG